MAESTRQREAFDSYWQLGAERSIERLHAAAFRQRHSTKPPHALRVVEPLPLAGPALRPRAPSRRCSRGGPP